MTALHVPDDGCCCSEDLAAVAQAVVDVLVGFQAMVCGDMFDPNVPQAMAFQAKATTILQNVLTDYAENHGSPDAYHDSLAFAHVNERMR